MGPASTKSQVQKQKMFSVEDKYQLLLKKKQPGCTVDLKSGFCFGRMESCRDYLDMIDENAKRENFVHVINALKQRPMRRLRGFNKRKFGTAPTILCHLNVRLPLDTRVGSLAQAEQSAGYSTDVKIETNSEDMFAAGEFVVFRGTDELPFNIIQVTKAAKRGKMIPNSKIFGNFLVPVDVEVENLVCFYQDPEWKGGSMLYKDLLYDEDDNCLTVTLHLICLDGYVGTYYAMCQQTHAELLIVSENFETMKVKGNKAASQIYQEDNDEDSSESEDGEIEPAPELPLVRSTRTNRGNRLPCIYTGLLK